MTVAHYYDPETGEQLPLGTPVWRSTAGGPLMVSAQPGITRGDIDASTRGSWRYRAALPLDVAQPISLGEGGTPLVQRDWGRPGAAANPHFKLEWFSPTGSFKDRGASVMLSMLRQQGITRVIEDSSGNGGAAIAAYGAAGGLDVTVFAPASTSPAKLVQARAYGATIELVEGPREASQRAAIKASALGDAFYASHNWQAMFLEGTKTLAYEIWEDLGFRAPDSVIVPVGAGSSLLGCALGFRELLRAGEISRLPRLYAAQPLNCSPVDAAFRVIGADSPKLDAALRARFVEKAQAVDRTAITRAALSRPVLPTVAEGTAIRQPLRLHEILTAILESGGDTVAIAEEDIMRAHAALARAGLYAEPTSATAAAAHTRLLASRAIHPDETTVVVLTGSGLKSPR